MAGISAKHASVMYPDVNVAPCADGVYNFRNMVTVAYAQGTKDRLLSGSVIGHPISDKRATLRGKRHGFPKSLKG